VWAINSSDGIIVIDANFHYSSKEPVLGLLNFASTREHQRRADHHAHDDCYWGACGLQDTLPLTPALDVGGGLGPAAKDNSPAQFAAQDMVIADGQKITLGDVTVTAYLTPGHTPGTLSFIIEPLWNKKSISSDNQRYVASIWGGTDPSIGRQGVQYYKDGQTMMRTHVESLKRFIDLESKAGVDVVLSPTLAHANMVQKLANWRIRNPDHSGGGGSDGPIPQFLKLEGQPHPFASREAVNRYNRILLECYEAQLA
jgi:metallo-beta-lactamase class B